MDKDIIIQQSREIKQTHEKHPLLPRTRGGWYLTGITTVGTCIVCAIYHFDGGTTLGGLFVVGTALGFSDDVLHALFYGKRFPEHLTANHHSAGAQIRRVAGDFAERWLGFDTGTDNDPRNNLKARAARWFGMPEPEYDTLQIPSDVVEAVLPVEPTQASQSVLEQHLEAQPDDDSMFLSRTLFPHANAVFSNRVAILGIPGAGKSNTVAVFAEELGKFGAPLVIFDTENEYRPLCAKPYFHRPFAANCSNVNLEMAFSFGQRIMDERLQVVLNLDSYDDDDLAALIMIDIIKGIQKWEEALANDDRIPCAVILDEAAVWLPQNGKESMLSKQKDEDGYTTLDKLQKVFFSVVVRRGRKRGIGFILASQRSAEIDKRAIASAQWKFLHLQNQPNDLDVYADFGVDKVTAQALGLGQAFVIGPGVKGVHQLRKRNSTDNAKTPGLESLRKRRYTESLAGKASQMILPVLPVIEPTRVVESRPSGGIQSQLERTAQKYQKAREAWENGNTSIRKLMPVMGLNFNQTRDLVDEMHRKGLIDKYEKSRSASE